jgi:hypothetical protein
MSAFSAQIFMYGFHFLARTNSNYFPKQLQVIARVIESVFSKEGTAVLSNISINSSSQKFI